MLGKVLAVNRLNETTKELMIEDYSDQSVVRVPVSRFSEIEAGDNISVHIEIVKIANCNFNHEYPEGTLKSPRI